MKNKKRNKNLGNPIDTYIPPWNDCKTIASAWQAGNARGFKYGTENGISIGKEEQKKIINRDLEERKLSLALEALQKAAYFQECITKLVMSINKDL